MNNTTEARVSKTSEIHQIYDRIFKKVITLSPKAVLHFINALYGTDYPVESKIDYHWTESHDKDLHRTLSDVILTINHQDTYHMEAQMTKDETIVTRVFRYGAQHAYKASATDEAGLSFPEPSIIYLDFQKNISDIQKIHIRFGRKNQYNYEVKCFCYQDYSLEELNQRKMIILIPFQLLKFRKIIEKNPSKENIMALKDLISDGIMQSIQNSYDTGDITKEDALILKDLTQKLCEHLYGKNEACIKEGVLNMYGDIILLESERLIDELRQAREELAKRNAELAERDAENARLRAQLVGTR